MQPASDFDYEIKLFRKHIPDIFNNQNILDVGCYDGSFMNALKFNGINSVGVEPNKEIACKGIEAGLNIITTKFERNKTIESLENISLVSFRECMYYIPDIDGTFELLDKILCREGFVYIKSVNSLSIYFSLCGSHAKRCGDNFTKLFTRKEMNEILIQHGYDIIYSGYYPHNVFHTLGFHGCDTVPLKIAGRILRPISEILEIADRYVIIAKKR